MKKKLLCSSILYAAGLLIVPNAFAQEVSSTTKPIVTEQLKPLGLDDIMPIDPNIRLGKLSNGLTYYIRKNSYRPGLCNFYIAQKVGSILEEPNQRGLAHFLEHMAFNGSAHFPTDGSKKSVVKWCESVGIKFGQNLNAYTSVDETVYNICDAPVTKSGVVDTCMLILRDWSHDLTLSDKEIDKERGVIREEWRTRSSAWQRMAEKAFPILFKDSKYADCLPIGSIDVINNFKYDELRSYYEKWYRPDLQGLIIVGDINPDEVEQKLKATFSDIVAKANPAKRIFYPVPDNREPLIAIEKDKEQTNTVISLFIKQSPVLPIAKDTIRAEVEDQVDNMIGSFLSQRLDEISKKSDAPFLGAGMGISSFYITDMKRATVLSVSCKEGKLKEGFTVAYRELLRAAQGGFTESELARYKANLMRGIESNYDNRMNKENSFYTYEYVRHFLDNRPACGEASYFLQIAPLFKLITLDQINARIKECVTKENRAIMVMAPEKEGLILPTSQEILACMDSVDAEKGIQAYKEEVDNSPLVSNLRPTGKITSEKAGPFGSTLLTLSNGVKVYVKSTNFKADEVILSGYRSGGLSLFPDSDAINWRNTSSVVSLGGIGNYSAINLSKRLAGIQAGVGNWIGDEYNGVSGGCAPKDFETMMQLTYLNFTAPRKDQEAFDAWKIEQKQSILNEKMEPSTAYSDSIELTTYGVKSDRYRRFTEADIDAIDYDHCIQLYRSMYDDASDFTFFIIGSVKLDSIRPMLEKYLGALPANYTKEKWQVRLLARKGTYNNHFERKQQTPKAQVNISVRAEIPYNYKTDLTMTMISSILRMEYTEKVREEKGGTYGVGVSAGATQVPANRCAISLSYDTDPKLESSLTPLLYDGLKNLAEKGPDAGKLAKTKDFLLKNYINQIYRNWYWNNCLQNKILEGVDIDTNYEKLVQSISGKDIQKLTKKILKQKNCIEVVMTDTVTPAPSGVK